MSNQEILWEAINRAIEGGWDPSSELLYYVNELECPVIIFNHDFAKALWGNVPLYTGPFMRVGNTSIEPKECLSATAWKYHLQQMVIADDPIQYLGQHL